MSSFGIQQTAGGWRAITRSPGGDDVGPTHADWAQAAFDSFEARSAYALWVHEVQEQTVRALTPAEREAILDAVTAGVRDNPDFEGSIAEIFELVDDLVEAAARRQVGALS